MSKDFGDTPNYELCKLIYLYHPLGQKMATAPVNLAQSQNRKITINDAPKEALDAFQKEWAKVGATEHIRNLRTLSRVYGIASIIVGCKVGGKTYPSDAPLDMEKIWDQELFFNVLDPLNTAGSLVLTQIPTEADFLKPVIVRVNGQVFHRSRHVVMMHESPIYLAYTNSAFGFVGRSVYQRALYPLKSFIRTMIADDMIATKLGLLVAKQKPPGAVLDKVMQRIAAIKRSLLRQAQTNQVLSIDVEEDIETLDMNNVDGAGTYARNNILKNIATAADMPAWFLENETMVEGFGEGTEDAKNIAKYVELERQLLQPAYAWFDNIVQYRAWNPAFFEYIKTLYPGEYDGEDPRDLFSKWRSSFTVEWPSLLIEPESEQIAVEKVKLESLVAIFEVMNQVADPVNKKLVLQWMMDNINEEKMLFPHSLDLDFDAMEEFIEEQQNKMDEQQDKLLQGQLDIMGGQADLLQGQATAASKGLIAAPAPMGMGAGPGGPGGPQPGGKTAKGGNPAPAGGVGPGGMKPNQQVANKFAKFGA